MSLVGRLMARSARVVPLLPRPPLVKTQPLAQSCCLHQRSLATAAAPEGSSTRRIGIVLFSGIVCTTAYLGAWQLYRYTWKIDLIEKRTARLSQAPKQLLDVVADPMAGMGADDEFVPVTCEGVLLHEHQALVGPRSAPPGGAP
eukprot:5359317-Prymnesium_polylepis.1